MLDKPSLYVIGSRGYGGEGGIENQIRLIVPFLANTFNVVVLVPSKSRFLRAVDGVVVRGVSYISLFRGFDKVVGSLLSSWIVFKEKPAVVYVQGIGAALWLPLIKLNRKTKIVVHVRSYDVVYNDWNILARMVFALINVLVRRLSDKILCVNTLFARMYPEEKAHFVEDAVVVYRTHREDVLNRFGLKKGSYVLSVGRITPIKRFEMLIQAVKHAGINRKVVIVGSIKDKNYFNYLRSLNSNVVFTGSVSKEELSSLYENAYAFVMCSAFEGMPNVVMEACMHNKAVFVSDIYAHRLLPFLKECAFFDSEEVLANRLKNPSICYDKKMLKNYHPRFIAEKIARHFIYLLSSSRSK